MPNTFDCVSIGAATLDLILKSKDFKIVKNSEFKTGTAICEMFGSKVEVDRFKVSSGGGATNSSCALAHFGLNTSCISAIGADAFSEVVIDDLNTYGVDTFNLKFSKKSQTPFSVILTAKGGGRTVLVYRGPKNKITVDDVIEKNLQTSWVYLTNLGDNFLVASEIISYLASKNIKIMWNPGSNELKNLHLGILESIDIFNLNLEEASILSQKKMADLKGILTFFVKEVSAKESLITLGEKGAFYIGGGSIFHVFPYKVAVANTLGAGDAFGSGFLYGVIKKLGVEKSLEYAIKNSASVVQKTGAKSGFLNNLSDFPDTKIKKIR